MELRHLRYFLAVAELGSFSRAAEKLFIAQPPLSTQIRDLEEELGVELLTRYSRGVRLTAAGTAFLEEAKHILERAERAKRVARHTHRVATGLLRIGYVPSAGHKILPKLIRRLRSALPESEFDVREMITAKQLPALQQGEIDVGLLRLPIQSTRIALVAELSEPFCLALPAKHPLAALTAIDLRSAAQEVFIGFARQRGPAFFDQTIAQCTEVGFSPQLRHEATSLYGLLNLVGAGLGIAIVPASAATLSSPDCVFRLLSNPLQAGTLALVQMRGDPNPLLATVAGLAKEAFAELSAEIKQIVVGLA